MLSTRSWSNIRASYVDDSVVLSDKEQKLRSRIEYAWMALKLCGGLRGEAVKYLARIMDKEGEFKGLHKETLYRTIMMAEHLMGTVDKVTGETGRAFVLQELMNSINELKGLKEMMVTVFEAEREENGGKVAKTYMQTHIDTILKIDKNITEKLKEYAKIVGTADDKGMDASSIAVNVEMNIAPEAARMLDLVMQQTEASNDGILDFSKMDIEDLQTD